MVGCPDPNRLIYLQGSEVLVYLPFESALLDVDDGLQDVRIKPVQMQVISMLDDEVAVNAD